MGVCLRVLKESSKTEVGSTPGGGRGGTAIYGLYGYVPL